MPTKAVTLLIWLTPQPLHTMSRHFTAQFVAVPGLQIPPCAMKLRVEGEHVDTY
jgi:hypothetical protein